MLKPKVLKIAAQIEELSLPEKAQLLVLYSLPPIVMFTGIIVFILIRYLKNKKNWKDKEIVLPRQKVQPVKLTDFF